MYTLKQIPEDFIVKEILLDQKILDQGKYILCKLTKKDFNTVFAIKKIAQFLRIPMKNIGFAGSKDRQAVTEQYITIKVENKVSKAKLIKFDTLGIILEIKGYVNTPLSLGDLSANKFEIVVRGLEEGKFEIEDKFSIVNFFGEQRFSKNNKEVGRALLKKDWGKAVELMIENSHREVKEYKKEHPTDKVGALRKLPKKILMLYIHSYQSYIWNETVKRFLTELPAEDIKVPILGFHTDLHTYHEKIQEITKEIMQEEEIKAKDFICKQIPFLSLEGDERQMLADIIGLKISEIAKDELNEKKLKLTLSFSLGKGSYATEVVKQLVTETTF